MVNKVTLINQSWARMSTNKWQVIQTNLWTEEIQLNEKQVQPTNQSWTGMSTWKATSGTYQSKLSKNVNKMWQVKESTKSEQ